MTLNIWLGRNISIVRTECVLNELLLPPIKRNSFLIAKFLVQNAQNSGGYETVRPPVNIYKSRSESSKCHPNQKRHKDNPWRGRRIGGNSHRLYPYYMQTRWTTFICLLRVIRWLKAISYSLYRLPCDLGFMRTNHVVTCANLYGVLVFLISFLFSSTNRMCLKDHIDR